MAIVIPLTLKHTSKKTDANLASEISPITEAVGDNFPDPSLLNINGIWYAFATNNAAGNLPRPRDDDKNSVPQPDLGVANIQVATSPDFKNWTLSAASGDPLPTVGSWAIQGRSTQSPFLSNSNVWAPAILQRPTDGKYVMYYAAAVTGRFHCMGAAISDPDSPTGPYSPLPESIACPVDQGGAIDPAAFIDIDNRIYVSWKIDGNAMGHGGSCGNMKAPQRDTPIMMQPMQPDGLTPIGSPIAILNRTAADGPLVEAPAFVRSSGGVYFLFFSSGCTHDSSYNLKYAWATNITGPYTRAPFPLIQTGDWGLVAPGSCDMIPDSDGGVALAFHARVWNEYGGVRAMFTSKLYLNGTRASLLAPRKSVNATVFANTTLSTPLGLPGNGTILASNSTAGDSTPDVEVQSLNSTTSFSSNSTVPFALNSDDDDD